MNPDSGTIEIFRTTVGTRRAAARLLRQLRACWPQWRITLDVADCDRVLRLHNPAGPVDGRAVAAVLAESGYLCEPLPDTGPAAAELFVFTAPADSCFPSNNSGI